MNAHYMRKLKKELLKPKLKKILTNGPNIRYIADLWVLNK